MNTLAFTTCQKWPEMNDDDRLVADILRSRSIDVHAAVWDDSTIDWSRFDAVVIRSAWDYHLKADRYAAWLRRFESAGTRLWNPPAAVLANMNKRYLLGLAEKGVEVVPTEYLPASDGVALRTVLERRRWEQAVVKPAVSASADGTWRTSLASADEDQTRFTAQLHDGDLLIQPFMPEIASHGEWSLMFFDGAYSHAVLKRPGSGDFRVQQHLGGDAIAATPSRTLIEQAGSILRHAGHPLLYARVDGIERDGRLVLMELEINEPFLFFGYAPDAPGRFAEAILTR